MAYTDARTIASQLKKGEIRNLYYIFGADVVRVERLTKQIIKAAVGDNEEFALTRMNGKKIDFNELYDTVQMMPMMSEYNCILVNDYNCEKPREDMRGYTADDLNKKLIEVLKEVPPQTVVVFNVTGFEVKVKKGKIADKNKKLADFIEKNGIVCEFGAKTPDELAKDIAAKVSARGGMISLDNARGLAEMCLSDTLAIDNEIDKLCAYANGREITADMLRELVHVQSDMTVYKLASAVASMNRRAAYEAIDELNIDNKNRGEVLGAVTGTFIDMYRAACARQSGRGVNEMTADFSYKWDFMVKNAFRDSSRMSVRKLREETRKKDREGVVITTMHRAKGLEWQVVFIIDADEKVIPHKKSVGVKRGIEEERRLFYVAITRAKDEVQILGCASPSRFLRELFFVEKKGKAGKASSAIEISPKQ